MDELRGTGNREFPDHPNMKFGGRKMVKLTNAGLSDADWSKTGVNIDARMSRLQMEQSAKIRPLVGHIAPSNLYTAMVGRMAQQLGFGVIGFETLDPEIVALSRAHDNLRLLAVMPPEGDDQINVIGSTADMLYSDPSSPQDWEKTLQYIACDSMQLVSVTCTEKGLRLDNEDAERDMLQGPDAPKNVMAKIAAMAYHRLRQGGSVGGRPIAFVSLDNMLQNGTKLKDRVLTVARAWAQGGKLDSGLDLVGYLENVVSFPCTMIDRITPRPSQALVDQLTARGIEDLIVKTTAKDVVTSQVVNTEHVSYLVMHDVFPNGRPDFAATSIGKDKVIMVDNHDTIGLVERMKLSLLNALHTTLACTGMVLGIEYIADQMKDQMIAGFIRKLGYDEILPKVVDPGCINGRGFLDEVVDERLPNRKLGDTSARIATDTSQKIAQRFGETIRAYGEDADQLKYVALAIGFWCRYLCGATERPKGDTTAFYGVNDNNQTMELSPDGVNNAMMRRLAKHTAKLDPTRAATLNMVHDAFAPILSDAEICSKDLYTNGLGQMIERYVHKMLQGPTSARRTLIEAVGE